MLENKDEVVVRMPSLRTTSHISPLIPIPDIVNIVSICLGERTSNSILPLLVVHFRDMLDLTHLLSTSTPVPVFDGHPTYSASPISCLPHDASNVHALSLGSHTGTHIDAPWHFIEGGKTIDQLDLRTLVGRALVLDVRGKKAHEKIVWEDIEKWEDVMHEGVIVLICTGWSRYWGKSNYGDHPYLDTSAAEKIVGKGVRVIGCDTMSPDEVGTDNPTHGVHRIVLGAGGVIAENLCNLEQVLELIEPVVSLLPLRLERCDGSPIRAVAWSSAQGPV
ncbi:hypothetical protein SERLA73DRAFT_178741 [Serpula lacrymans var. lacrymans S7.3]|uniref:Cyclase n=2 Tax=Serpula lacrymans var. lacrymans TaxID=341189 RepID=F8PSP1_SERL3|nr:uncharacterized protein SERLADRAFT_463346 [Serpula lacrymans var. lacrymans S7.9]EGO00800.1 hypothetical protein SERLA73DRAFT_178741 [Serpula lacrymans var. lacrymans S7.3]EGO26360.1 hypothetical protein SERLADRAFT_463346 [Serpula lacrymans var. lacrymans S7.9]